MYNFRSSELEDQLVLELKVDLTYVMVEDLSCLIAIIQRRGFIWHFEINLPNTFFPKDFFP